MSGPRMIVLLFAVAVAVLEVAAKKKASLVRSKFEQEQVPVNFRGSGQIQRSQIDAALSKELAFADKDLAEFEDGLRDMFVSLPKNRYGNLGHDSVRLALHRFFVHRHGWWLRGLFLTQSPDNDTTVEEKDRVPELLQEAFERSTARTGASLHDLAALAASVEELVTKETIAHLRDSYQATAVSMDHPIHRTVVRDVIHTYFLSFLLEHNWTVDGLGDLLRKKEIIAEKYPLYSNSTDWLLRVFNDSMSSLDRADFNQTLKVANMVGERFHDLNDKECDDLSETLQKMESRKPGRVRLSVFYNASIHSHWNFNEKVDMLRDLGVLDESDSSSKYVIIANYAMSRPNCVNTSNIYEVCCPDKCENIMRHLESDIGGAVSSPERIARLVSNLRGVSSSSTTFQLSEALLHRLQEVANQHGGQVPLHGRLFAQWLHHVFPLTCAYPQEAASVKPASWGRGDDRASESEIREHIEADSCHVNFEGRIDCGEESADLPWSTQEELLGSEMELQGVRKQFLVVVGLTILAAAALMRVALNKQKSVNVNRSKALLLAVALALLAVWVGLLDPVVLVIAALGGLVANFMAVRAQRSKLPTVLKTV